VGRRRKDAFRRQWPDQLTLVLDAGDDDGPPCFSSDPELFFAESPEDVERAKLICGASAVRQQCLTGALERHEMWGVWGGEYFESGFVIPRKRPRGRPRKHAIPTVKQ